MSEDLVECHCYHWECYGLRQRRRSESSSHFLRGEEIVEVSLLWVHRLPLLLDEVAETRPSPRGIQRSPNRSSSQGHCFHLDFQLLPDCLERHHCCLSANHFLTGVHFSRGRLLDPEGSL